MDDPLFFNIQAPEIPENFDGFTLETRWYEFLIGLDLGGFDLTKIGYDGLQSIHDLWGGGPEWQGKMPEEMAEIFERMLPTHHKKTSPETVAKLKSLADKRRNPLSQSLENLEELAQTMINVYQLSYAHYALGKNYPLENFFSFPVSCCGISSRGLFGSLILNGYHNSTIASSIKPEEHTYIILPFHIEESSEDGVIILDPTSDQQSRYEGVVRRNLTSLRKGLDWELRFDYKGKDFFPDYTLPLGTLTKEGVFREDNQIEWDHKFYENPKSHLERAYANPQKLDIKE